MTSGEINIDLGALKQEEGDRRLEEVLNRLLDEGTDLHDPLGMSHAMWAAFIAGVDFATTEVAAQLIENGLNVNLHRHPPGQT